MRIRRVLAILAWLTLLTGVAFAEELTAPPLWLSEVPDVPDMPRMPEYAYADGLLEIRGLDDVLAASLEYELYDDQGGETVYSYALTYDASRTGWYSEEAAADANRPDIIRVETATLRCADHGGIAEITLLENGEPRYMWEYWLEPFEGLSMADAPFISLVIYPSEDWPMLTRYGGYGELDRYVYTAADGAQVWYEAHGLVSVTLEKDGVQYAYTPSGGRYPAGWSACTGSGSHDSGYVACDAPEDVDVGDYGPLIDQAVWLEVVREAFAGR